MEMRNKCEKCDIILNHESDAYICSYEFTFCSTCSTGMNYNCINCNGELVIRPKRKVQ
ncbi:DUF1272 domain-containing protein [Flagellimonas aquimarina]